VAVTALALIVFLVQPLEVILHAAVTEVAHDVTNDRANVADSTTFTGSAGDTYVVGIVRTDGTGTFSMADTVNGSWGAAAITEGSDTWVFDKRNVSAGLTTVNLTCTDGVSHYSATWLHIRGHDTSASLLTDTNTGDSGTSHTAATTGLTGTGMIIGLGANNSLVDVTLGSGYTSDNTLTAVGYMLERKIGTFSAEKPPWTTSASDSAHGLAILFVEATGGGGVAPGLGVLLGAGR